MLNGGTGATTSTGSGSVVLATSPTISTILTVSSAVTTSASITDQFAGSLAVGQFLIKKFGVDELATNNSVRQVFGYTGSGSALNTWAFQFYNAGTTMLLKTPGTLATSTTTAAVTITGGLGISDSFYAGSSINLRNSSVASFTAETLFGASLGSGNVITHLIGVSAATNNSAATQFVYTGGSGSNTNYWSVGLSGNTETIRVRPSGISATTPTTAAVTIAGGLGVSDSFFAGVSINLASASVASFTCSTLYAASLGSGNGITQLIGVSATTNNSGTIQFVYTGSGSTSNYFALGLAGANTLFISPAGTASTSTATGAVRVTGGLGVTGDIYCTNLFGNVTGSITQTLLTISNPTVSGALFTIGTILAPSLTAGGGLSLYMGTSTSVTGNGVQLTFVYVGSGSASNFYGVGIVGNTYSTKVFAANIASTTPTTGTLLVSGGLGVNGDLFATTLNLTSNSSTSFACAKWFAPLLGAASGMTQLMGVSASTNDCGTIQFVYTSTGSTSNYFAFGLAGANTLLISPAGTASTRYFFHPC